MPNNTTSNPIPFDDPKAMKRVSHIGTSIPYKNSCLHMVMSAHVPITHLAHNITLYKASFLILKYIVTKREVGGGCYGYFSYNTFTLINIWLGNTAKILNTII